MTTATKTETVHDTIVLERTYKASPQRVFAAWSDIEARKRWSAPSPEIEVVFDRHEFKAGGIDIARCGARGDLRYLAEVRYLDIVPQERVVVAETVAEAAKRVCCSLITTEFHAKGKDTRLVLTVQIAALEGSDMIAGNRHGWTAALDNLAHEFASAVAG